MQRTCVAIKTDGEQCTKKLRNDGTHCSTHAKLIIAHGPNTVKLREMNYIHKREMKLLETHWDELIVNTRNDEQREQLNIQKEFEMMTKQTNYEREYRLTIARQEAEIRRTGIDPDREANERKEREREERRNAQLAAQQRHMQIRMANNIANIVVENNNNNINANVNNELARFVNDNQNVHTTVAVNQTKDIVERLLKIPVPEEYRWNMDICSKTPGDIITQCKLTPKATWQMSSKYCQNEEIYGLGLGIYGKVLDAVWQYTLNSPNKNDICIALKQEMEDNIGMCAQGNLSRLCNILAGHMEGIIAQESPVSIVGRKLPKLMEIEDINERIKQAYTHLIESGMPEADWDTWLKVLIQDQLEDEEDEEYYKFDRIKDSNNNIVGLKLDISYTINYDN